MRRVFLSLLIFLGCAQARVPFLHRLLIGLFLGLTLAAETGRAQGVRKDDIVINARGQPVAGANVRVCASAAAAGVTPCTPLALIYSDRAMTQALANPTMTDGLGNYFFYAAPGRYMVEISGPTLTTRQIPDVVVPNDPSAAATSLRASQYIGIDMPAPGIPTLTQAAGGTLVNATYYVLVTAVDYTNGETTASPVQSIALSGGNGTLNSSWGGIVGAAGYNVYRATATEQAANAWHKFSATSTSFSDNGASGTFPSSPPAITTAAISKITAGSVAAPQVALAGSLGGTTTLGPQAAALGAIVFPAASGTLPLPSSSVTWTGTHAFTQGVTAASLITNGAGAGVIDLVSGTCQAGSAGNVRLCGNSGATSVSENGAAVEPIVIAPSSPRTILSATHSPGSQTIAAQSCTENSLTLTGALAGARVAISPNYALEANLSVGPGYVTAAGTVKYRICNPTAAGITTAAGAAYNLAVIQ